MKPIIPYIDIAVPILKRNGTTCSPTPNLRMSNSIMVVQMGFHVLTKLERNHFFLCLATCLRIFSLFLCMCCVEKDFASSHTKYMFLMETRNTIASKVILQADLHRWSPGNPNCTTEI